MRLCKELIEKDGAKWKISKERRELDKMKEIEREDRLDKARKKREEFQEGIKCREI